jgi:hypothetical protein
METITPKVEKYANLGKKGKISKVLFHLKEKGSISSWEAIELYGATRLSDIIFKLRRRYDIESVSQKFSDRYGNVSTYAVYVYHGEYKSNNK